MARPSRMFPKAVAAISTPLRSRPLDSEKTVLTPSLCSVPVWAESPTNTAFPRTSRAVPVPGQTVEHEVVRDRGDRARRAVEVEVRRVGARVETNQAPEQALRPCLRRIWRTSEYRGQAVPDGSVSFHRLTQGAHRLLGVYRGVQHDVRQWRPVGPSGAGAFEKRAEGSVCLSRVDVKCHDGKARRVARARLEGPVPAHSYRHFGEWERRETSRSPAQGGQRRGEAFEVVRIGNAARVGTRDRHILPHQLLSKDDRPGAPHRLGQSSVVDRRSWLVEDNVEHDRRSAATVKGIDELGMLGSRPAVWV